MAYKRNKFYRLVCLGIVFFVCFLVFLYTEQLKMEKTSVMTPKNEILLKFKNTPLREYLRQNQKTCIVCSDILKNQCKLLKSKPKKQEKIVVYFVASHPSNVNQRRAIRLTWGTIVNIPPIFMLGHTFNEAEMEIVRTEAAMNKDIIMEDFRDSYLNLTIKTGFILKNFLKMCPDADYLVKIDDDMFLNPYRTEALINSINGTGIAGFIETHSYPIRDPLEKWYMPKFVYRGNKYPPYLMGGSYIIPGEMAWKIYNAALRTPLIPFEDLFFTGIVASESLQIPLINCNSIIKKYIYITDLYKFSQFAIVHYVTPRQMFKIWMNVKLNKYNETESTMEKIKRVIQLIRYLYFGK